MNLDRSVIGNEAKFAEFIHEKADPGACCADHFRQRFLTNMRRDGLWAAFLSEIGQEQEKAREPFLTRIK
jgi:hypothetical protein